MFRAVSFAHRVSQRSYSVLAEAYMKNISSGKLHYDVSQMNAIRRLDRVAKKVIAYQQDYDVYLKEVAEWQNECGDLETQYQTKVSSESPMLSSKGNMYPEKPAQPPIPRGMYLYGPVGTGKSMLMDTLFENIEVRRKRRVHFNAFMTEVHSRIRDFKQGLLAQYGRDKSVDLTPEKDAISHVARSIADEALLLCFDEFQVTDVADALIMTRLFKTIFSSGTVVVATSNRPPDDLYQNGLNREYFLSFIDLLKLYCKVHDMASNTDYRKQAIGCGERFFAKSIGKGPQLYENEMKGFEGLNGSAGWRTKTLPVAMGRSIEVEVHSGEFDAIKADFHTLCCTPRSANDFRALAAHADILFLEGVPILTRKQHNEAKRLILLVDELYEAKTQLVCQAEGTPTEIFQAFLDGTHVIVESADGDDVNQDSQHQQGVTSTVASAAMDELGFAVARAISRLGEITSPVFGDS